MLGMGAPCGKQAVPRQNAGGLPERLRRIEAPKRRLGSTPQVDRTGEGVLGRGDGRYKGTGPERERGALKESLEQGCHYLPGSLMNVGMERDLSVLLTFDEEIEVFLCSGK